MTETTTTNQTEDWGAELASAMVDQEWRRALKLCSWLRYDMEEQDRSDPELERMHRQAKEGLAEQVAQERAQRARQTEHRRLQLMAVNQSASGTWTQALDSIEMFYQDGASQQEALGLLQELKRRLADRLLPAYWQIDPKAAVLAKRFNKLLDHIRSED